MMIDYATLLILPGNTPQLVYQRSQLPCMVGANGVTQNKQEGDHATPAALLPLRRIFYRADRVKRPETALPCEALSPQDGWCDDSTHPDYNRFVTVPHPGRHERLWRDDHAYDLIAVLGWNDDPPVRHRGSAIFLHLPTERGTTEGCIALAEPLWRTLIANGVSGIDTRL